MSRVLLPPSKPSRIDGTDVSARADQTILDAARENEISIPTLCHLDGLSEVGACRLCLVEVKGTSRLLPACVTLRRRRHGGSPPNRRASKNTGA